MDGETSKQSKTQTAKHEEQSEKNPKRKVAFKFLPEANLRDLSRDEIYAYVITLHKHIQKLVCRCRKYREKVLKLVSFKRLEHLA